jgi:hypothetical protein
MSLMIASLGYPRGVAFHHFGVRNPGDLADFAARGGRAASPPVQLISRQNPRDPALRLGSPG